MELLAELQAAKVLDGPADVIEETPQQLWAVRFAWVIVHHHSPSALGVIVDQRRASRCVLDPVISFQGALQLLNAAILDLVPDVTREIHA